MSRADIPVIAKTPARVALAIVGLILTGLGALVISLVIRDWRAGDDWNRLAAIAAIGLAVVIGGCKSLYVGVTGRVRGRINRWLSATFESLMNTMP